MGPSNHRREDHVRHHNDVPAHVGQTGAELVRKTVRSILGDLTAYTQAAHLGRLLKKLLGSKAQKKEQNHYFQLKK